MRKERMRRKWTLEYVGSCVGVGKPAVYAWEIGKTFPRKQYHDALRNLFGKTLDSLLSEAPLPKNKRTS